MSQIQSNGNKDDLGIEDGDETDVVITLSYVNSEDVTQVINHIMM